MSWRPITCEEREALVDRIGRSYNGFSSETGVGPTRSLTDMHGTYGEPYVFTEWGYDEDRPVLQDHRWPGSERPCEHKVWEESFRCAICGDDSEPAECPDLHGWDDHGLCCVGACRVCQGHIEDDYKGEDL